MKTLITLTSCALALNLKAACVLLKFSHEPSAATCAALAATQPNTTPAEVLAWFKSGERGFILSEIHTNEICAAVKDGATIKTIKH